MIKNEFNEKDKQKLSIMNDVALMSWDVNDSNNRKETNNERR